MKTNAHDTAQICLNGHVINRAYGDSPEFNQRHCSDCGKPTINACPACNVPIKGYLRDSFVISLSPDPPPAYCYSCGAPYPWQATRLTNALELLEIEGFSTEQIKEIKRNLPDLVRDTPGTKLAAARIKLLLKAGGNALFEIGVKVLSDVLTSEARREVGLPP